jgi:antitoxin component YwqK of YwqJK toxin-antitoxin module
MYVDKYVNGIRDGIQQIYNCKNVKTLEFRYCRGYGPYNIKQWITVPYLNSYTVLERLLALGGVFQVDDGYPSKMGNGHNILIQADNLTNSTLYFSLANTAKNLSRVGTCDIKRGALNGVFKWYNRGVMVSVGTVVDGFTVGPWYRWSQTGVVKSGEMPKSANF